MSFEDLPTLNASLNLFATMLLIGGFAAICGGATSLHARLMVAAFVVSTLFLISYVVYHYSHPSTKYTGEGALRAVYFTVLISHILLAVTVPPLAIRTLYLAARKRWESHRRWARWTFPIWLYVSVTGVVIYAMLYIWSPAT